MGSGPEWGYTDWSNKLTVTSPPDPFIESNWYIDPASVESGNSFTAYYYITNPSSINKAAWLGASIRETGTTTGISDDAHDTVVTLAPGSHWYTRTFTVPADAVAGSYDVMLGLHGGNVVGSGPEWGYTDWSNKLTVSSTMDTTAPSISITSPTSGTTVSISTITVSGTASDDTAVASVTVNGIPATGTANWNAEVNLIEGENVITIIATDLANNKKISKLQVFYYEQSDIHPLFSTPLQIEVGGTFYRWYKTIPSSSISIDSNHLEYSQPDETGIFSVLINTSKLGITAPRTLDIVTNSVSITKNGQTIQADTSTLNFALNILPRNYSTSWYLGSTIGGGGGIVKYAEGERNVDFTMTTGNRDSILLMNRDKNDKATLGATLSLFELDAPLMSEVEVAKRDMHVGIQKISGSQVNIDYENANDTKKLEGSLYILTSTISAADPLMYKTINTISNELTDLPTDYTESGVAISGGIVGNLFKVGFGPETEGVKATIGSSDIGLGGEAAISLRNRAYPVNNFQEYLIQYVYNADLGLSGSILGNDLIEWGPSQYIDNTLIIGKDADDKIFGKNKIKESEKLVMSKYVSREITYDYGQIDVENIVNPILSGDFSTSSTLDEIRKISDNGNITVYETRGNKSFLELPLDLTVLGTKFSLIRAINMGDANNYLTDKYILYNQEKYIIEKYDYDGHVQESAEELNYIVESLLAPVNKMMKDVIIIISDVAEKGKEIIFTTGSIVFDPDTYFTSNDESAATSAYVTTLQSPLSDQSPEINISTYIPNNPSSQAAATFSSMGISASYVSSLSGAEFVIGNITDLQPHNISFTPAAQLTLNYTEADINGIDETNISIYKWDNPNNSWMPLPSLVNTIENNVVTNITSFGTYAIGYDITDPSIEWNSSNVYQGNITIEAIITDSGSGVNTSSIRLFMDGNEQNFTYNIFSGLIKSTINASVSNHTIRIFAEDSSGNSNFTEKEVINIQPSLIKNLIFNYTSNDTLELSWDFESGSYLIDQYYIYRDTELIANTTKTNFTTNYTYSATYTIFPIDTNGNTGISESITFRLGQLIPQFTYNWENTFYPMVGNLITFNATNSHLINGTVETNITSYTWIFDDDVNNTSSGKVIDHTFTDSGLHKVKLQIDDNFLHNETLIKIINIKNAMGSGDFSGDGTTDSWDITYLARSITGIPGYDTLSSGDVSGDGVVDAWDCTYLARAIAGVPEYSV